MVLVLFGRYPHGDKSPRYCYEADFSRLVRLGGLRNYSPTVYRRVDMNDLSVNKDIMIQDCSMMKGNPMSKNFQLEEPILYTTGAHIQPLKVVDDAGNEKWFWVVSEFDGDTFLDGETFNPAENGLTRQELLLAQQ